MVVGREVLSEGLDGGALAGAGDAGDAHADRLPRVGQTAFYHLAGLLLMGVQRALHQRDGTAQQGAVAMQDTAHKFLDRGLLLPTGAHALDIAIAHLFRLLHAFLHIQGCLVVEIAVQSLVFGGHLEFFLVFRAFCKGFILSVERFFFSKYLVMSGIVSIFAPVFERTTAG